MRITSIHYKYMLLRAIQIDTRAYVAPCRRENTLHIYAVTIAYSAAQNANLPSRPNSLSSSLMNIN
jgi:hypothetical protein